MKLRDAVSSSRLEAEPCELPLREGCSFSASVHSVFFPLLRKGHMILRGKAPPPKKKRNTGRLSCCPEFSSADLTLTK